jgi:hypothetical protein
MLGQVGMGADFELALAYLIVYVAPLAIAAIVGLCWFVSLARRWLSRIETLAFGFYWFFIFSICRTYYRFISGE